MNPHLNPILYGSRADSTRGCKNKPEPVLIGSETRGDPKPELPSIGMGGARAIELKQPMRDYESHSPNHDVEGGDYFGGGKGARGGINEGPTCCTEMPY
jgi:hypothetical protein